MIAASPRKCWRVRFYMRHVLLADLVVEAATRDIAKGAAKAHVRATRFDRYLATDKITVSPMH